MRYKPGRESKDYMKVRTVWPETMYTRRRRRIAAKKKSGKGA